MEESSISRTIMDKPEKQDLEKVLPEKRWQPLFIYLFISVFIFVEKYTTT